MVDSKCIMIMKNLTEEELKEFGRFAASPYFNRLNDVTKLFNALKKYHPAYPAEAVDKRKIFKKLFPKKPYNDSRMRNLVSDLGQLTEKFLLNKSWEENNYYKDTVYLSYILNRGLYSLFEKNHKKLSGKQTEEELDSHYKKYTMASLLGDYYLYTNRQHEAAEASYEKFDSLVGFYLYTMVRGLYDFKVHRNMHEYEKTYSLLREFAAHFDFNGFRVRSGFAEKNEYIFINIQYYFFEMLTGPDFEEYFNELLNLVSEYEVKLTHQSKYDIYLNLNNVLAFKIYEDGMDYFHHRLRIVKETISKNLYHHNEKFPVMPLILFITGVNLAMKSGEPEYAAYLYENYITATPQESRISLTDYTKAYMEFAKGNFDKSLEHLNRVDYEVVPLRKHVKNLALLLYYELGHFDSAESLVSSYRQYMKRTDGFKGMYGIWYENFLKFYSELLKFKMEKNPVSGEVKEKLEGTDKTLFKNWLINKYN